MPVNYLGFNISIGKQKPESIINTTTKCPFCDREHLTDILAEDGDLLLIKNKYTVLEDAFQTVLIETKDCNSELSEYTPNQLHKLIRFGIKNWLQMHRSGKYKSVLFLKNHGPLSGGTIRHPHMQIIGLKNINCYADINPKDFEGIVIDKTPGIEFNLSTYPRIGFSEFNIRLDDMEQIDKLADYLQIAVRHLLSYHIRCKSYNLFFYLINDSIRVKILPRFATSPLFIGYNLHLVSSDTNYIVNLIRETYFKK